MKKTDIKKDALLQASNGAIVTSVAGNPKAIGYVGFGYVQGEVKGVTINDIAITIENGKSGKFPLSRKLYFIVNENNLSSQANEFVQYILGIKGQAIVKEEGFIPLK